MHDPRDRLHLVRHGEVHNPDHIVYAAMPGFGLSDRGRAQAEAAAAHLAPRRVVRVVSSPLERAVATAQRIAAPHHVAVETRDDLIEWTLLSRWAGRVWEALPKEMPGEIEAYLTDPMHLPFSPESLEDMTRRVVDAAVDAWHGAPGPGDVVIVGHQDPTQAARLRLTGRGPATFHRDKPHHASVITLATTASGWREVVVFTPPQA